MSDEAAACAFLDSFSYYRFKGYLLHFERRVPQDQSHAVPAGTTFEQVAELCELDRKLRLLMFEAIERIEIAFRTAICNTYATGYKDPHWLLTPEHFVEDRTTPTGPSFQERLLRTIKREIGLEPLQNGELREPEIFVKHYLCKYTAPDIPPAWVLAECLSMGAWSQLYAKLSNRKAKLAVARHFVISTPVMESWIHALTVVRNTCAHHGRLWNRGFAIQPAALGGYEAHFRNPASFYTVAFCAAYLLRRIAPSTQWHLRMKEILLTCRHPMAVGCLPNWDKDIFWTETSLPPLVVKTLPTAQ